MPAVKEEVPPPTSATAGKASPWRAPDEMSDGDPVTPAAERTGGSSDRPTASETPASPDGGPAERSSPALRSSAALTASAPPPTPAEHGGTTRSTPSLSRMGAPVEPTPDERPTTTIPVVPAGPTPPPEAAATARVGHSPGAPPQGGPAHPGSFPSGGAAHAPSHSPPPGVPLPPNAAPTIQTGPGAPPTPPPGASAPRGGTAVDIPVAAIAHSGPPGGPPPGGPPPGGPGGPYGPVGPGGPGGPGGPVAPGGPASGPGGPGGPPPRTRAATGGGDNQKYKRLALQALGLVGVAVISGSLYLALRPDGGTEDVRTGGTGDTTALDSSAPSESSGPEETSRFEKKAERFDEGSHVDCVESSYGGPAQQFFEEQQCESLHRWLYATETDQGEQVVVSVVSTTMPDEQAARDLQALLDTDNTGNVKDLLREDVRFDGGPTELHRRGSEYGYASQLESRTLTVVETAFFDPGRTGDKDLLRQIAQEGLELAWDDGS
ncbi:hypothetical protein [Actinoalloteichus caeruleus]|uniref:hypothetical protein n=1 Tax=Actinoalloteichus cyanogriseus TaxID=2893586 RepID=UPI003BB8F8D5